MMRYPMLTALTLLGLMLAQAASLSAFAAERAHTAEPLDALTYTVVRTPPAERIQVPPLERDRNVLVDRVQPFPGRRVPDVFWYDNTGMSYGLVYQKTRAPLVEPLRVCRRLHPLQGWRHGNEDAIDTVPGGAA